MVTGVPVGTVGPTRDLRWRMRVSSYLRVTYVLRYVRGQSMAIPYPPDVDLMTPDGPDASRAARAHVKSQISSAETNERGLMGKSEISTLAGNGIMRSG